MRCEWPDGSNLKSETSDLYKQIEVIRWEEDYTQQGRRRIAKGSPGGRILAMFEEH